MAILDSTMAKPVCDPCLSISRANGSRQNSKPRGAPYACAKCRLPACAEHYNHKARMCVLCVEAAEHESVSRAMRSYGEARI